jgi:hypothetical protein
MIPCLLVCFSKLYIWEGLMKRTKCGRRLVMFACLVICAGRSSQAALVFSDTFEGGTVGNNIGAPWGANNITPATYQSAGNPFSHGAIYGDLNDPGPGTSPSQAIRLLSNAGNDNSLSPSLAGQVSTYSFDFWEPNRAGDVNSLVFGYYRQQSNVDLNSAGRNYSSLLHDGVLNPQGTLVSGAAVNYSQETVNTVFMMVNDSAASVVNYEGTGRTLAATTADVWISLGGAAPIYAFTVNKQSTASPIAGIGFRTNNADIERFFVDNVLLVTGATFDRSQVPEPASVALASLPIGLIVLSRRARRQLFHHV